MMTEKCVHLKLSKSRIFILEQKNKRTKVKDGKKKSCRSFSSLERSTLHTHTNKHIKHTLNDIYCPCSYKKTSHIDMYKKNFSVHVPTSCIGSKMSVFGLMVGLSAVPWLIRRGSWWKRTTKTPAVLQSCRCSSGRLAPWQRGHLREGREHRISSVRNGKHTQSELIWGPSPVWAVLFKISPHLLGVGWRGCELLRQQ